LSFIEKKRRQEQIDRILSDTDDEFHKYEGIPVAPNGVSVDKNIKEAEEFRESLQGLPADIKLQKKIEYVMSNVPNNHPMDYKQNGREYERFGNFNYGAVMNALGFSEFTAKVGGGYAQVRAGTSRAGWVSTLWDSPKDQWDIKQGYEYYEKEHRK
jgi:hypothetical protein